MKQLDLFTGFPDGFPAYHAENPHIYEAFKKYTFQLINAGRKNIGSKLIIERLRWDTLITGNDDFKINNNYAPFYSRLFMNEFPEHLGFFRQRESKFDNVI